jgi:hypothetical protein
MKRDGLTLGWGMAGAAWIAARFPAAANVELRDDGTARVACGTQDIGTGTYTILAQLTSQRTGVPLEKVEVALGDTSLPEGPISGGSMATGSVIPAVFAAADSAIASLLTLATTTQGTPFEKRNANELSFEHGRVFVKADSSASGLPFADLLRRATAGSGSASTLRPRTSLSERELEVLGLIAQGLSNQVIGERLYVTSVEIKKPTTRYAQLTDGYDRDTGEGAGTLPQGRNLATRSLGHPDRRGRAYPVHCEHGRVDPGFRRRKASLEMPSRRLRHPPTCRRHRAILRSDSCGKRRPMMSL